MEVFAEYKGGLVMDKYDLGKKPRGTYHVEVTVKNVPGRKTNMARQGDVIDNFISEKNLVHGR